MAEATHTQEEQDALVRDVYAFASEQLRKGLEDRNVEQLIKRGLPANVASTVVFNLSTHAARSAIP